MSRNTLTQHMRVLEECLEAKPAEPDPFSFGSGCYRLRVANDLESRRKAYRLVYKQYREKEYAQSHPSRMWLSIFDALPETTTLLVERTDTGEAVGALTVIFDSPMGLPADELYKPEIDALRAKGHRPCEFVSLAVGEEGEGGNAVLVELYSLVSIYAREVGGATDIVITVNPRHTGFYRRTLLFEEIGPERSYEKVGGAPAVLQRLDFDVQRESIDREHEPRPESSRRLRVLYRLFHPLEEDATIAGRLDRAARPMTKRERAYFFVEETDLLARAAPEQRAYLRGCDLLHEVEGLCTISTTDTSAI